MRHRLLVVLAFAASFTGPSGAQAPGELVWAGDAEGGSPFVEADPDDPERVVGFEVEVASLLAEELGRTPRFLQVGFTSLDAAAARGYFDVGLSGIEDSAARRSRLAVTIPYYQFREILTVRDVDAARYRSLEDLRGLPAAIDWAAWAGDGGPGRSSGLKRGSVMALFLQRVVSPTSRRPFECVVS